MPTSIVAGDLNDDGLVDLIVNSNGNAFNLDRPLIIFFSGGNGSLFDSAYRYTKPLIANTVSLTIGDFDNDGKINDFAICDENGLVTTYLQRNGTYGRIYDYEFGALKYMFAFPTITD